ncbi:hypothetical protein [Rhizobium sp. AG207R]|uniref:hypothetical protein n=1 Tax=Rhizobium sp. AG207R TaxID=2802287 RepID=UPI0022ABC86B|nr:hypothetical protein [Rhizobium sp. AG207R]MCZ3377469.1 hypothetical protein [Rhizobium sp. AG207R]
MSHAAENFIRGAEAARRLAADYRRDAQSNETPPALRDKWLADAVRADERADWYENHARMMQ